jgi:hypothetical protein
MIVTTLLWSQSISFDNSKSEVFALKSSSNMMFWGLILNGLSSACNLHKDRSVPWLYQ